MLMKKVFIKDGLKLNFNDDISEDGIEYPNR